MESWSSILECVLIMDGIKLEFVLFFVAYSSKMLTEVTLNPFAVLSC